MKRLFTTLKEIGPQPNDKNIIKKFGVQNHGTLSCDRLVDIMQGPQETWHSFLIEQEFSELLTAACLLDSPMRKT